MMMGLGVGGVAVGMFHLITHAFFKALLFLGAGSVIHGCNGEQDIRRMGGLRKFMPITFTAYSAGMLALCGFPFFFSGFWSKDEILRAAHNWSISQTPFYMAAFGALLTAFYMTRQMVYVFAGSSRLAEATADSHHTAHHDPHESPTVMTAPLVILATCAVLLGFIGTPAWPWFQSFLEGNRATFSLPTLFSAGIIPIMLSSSLLVFLGLGLGWHFYGRKPLESATAPDALGSLQPSAYSLLSHAYFIDAFYKATLIRLNLFFAKLSAWLDRWVWNGVVQSISLIVIGFAWLDHFFDRYIVNAGFDGSCEGLSRGGQLLALLQGGRVQGYLRVIGCALVALTIFLLWGAK
jgi:NADH-quinone oxidoreductase subunit L